MDGTVGTFVAKVRHLLNDGNRSDYWTGVWSILEAQPIWATGLNFSFQLHRLDGLPDAPAKLIALPLQQEGRWDSISLAQLALLGMGGNETLSAFSATLRAARIEIVKSRLFCIASHLSLPANASAPKNPDENLDKWLSDLEGVSYSYADDIYCEPLTAPLNVQPEGSAFWLNRWLDFRYDDFESPVVIDSRYVDLEDGDAPFSTPVDRSIVLYAAAFSWHDYSLAYENNLELAAAAALAMFFAMQSAEADDSDESASVPTAKNWGRLGGLERHRQSRSLKEWALEEAAQNQGADMEVARRLATRLPEKYIGVSEDPVRLIYSAIRAGRAARLREAEKLTKLAARPLT